MLMRSHCDLGVGASGRSMFLSRRSQYLAVFAHPLESRRDRLLYPQRVLLEKGGAIAPFAPPPWLRHCVHSHRQKSIVFVK